LLHSRIKLQIFILQNPGCESKIDKAMDYAVHEAIAIMAKQDSQSGSSVCESDERSAAG